jgi:hypothetical protein
MRISFSFLYLVLGATFVLALLTPISTDAAVAQTQYVTCDILDAEDGSSFEVCYMFSSETPSPAQFENGTTVYIGRSQYVNIYDVLEGVSDGDVVNNTDNSLLFTIKVGRDATSNECYVSVSSFQSIESCQNCVYCGDDKYSVDCTGIANGRNVTCEPSLFAKSCIFFPLTKQALSTTAAPTAMTNTPTQPNTAAPTITIAEAVTGITITFGNVQELDEKDPFQDAVSAWFDEYFNGQRRERDLQQRQTDAYGDNSVKNMRSVIDITNQLQTQDGNTITYRQTMEYDATSETPLSKDLALLPYQNATYKTILLELLRDEVPGFNSLTGILQPEIIAPSPTIVPLRRPTEAPWTSAPTTNTGAPTQPKTPIKESVTGITITYGNVKELTERDPFQDTTAAWFDAYFNDEGRRQQ